MSKPCSSCKQNVTNVKSPGVQCGGRCKLFFHYACESISSGECDLIEKKKLIWICKECRKARTSMIFPRSSDNSALVDENNSADSQVDKKEIENIKNTQNEIKDGIENLMKIVTEVNEKFGIFSKVLDSIEQLKIKMENVESKIMLQENNIFAEVRPKTNTETFVEILKKNTKSVFLVQPKDIEQTSEVTHGQLRSSIDPANANIRGVRKTRNGGVVVTCKDTQSVEQCQKDVLTKLGDNYTVKSLENKQPLLKIVGLYSKITEEQLIEKIQMQNDVISENSEIKLIEMKENPRGITAVISADCNTYENIMKIGKLNIEWERCMVYPFFKITRCFNCQDYNHISRFCEKTIVCGKCSGEHKSESCTSDFVKCSNCVFAKDVLKVNMEIDINHCAWSIHCPVFKRKQEGLINKLKSNN